MGTDIHAPLGQNRKERPQSAGPSRFPAGNAVFAVAVAGLLGFSGWTAMAPSGLLTTPLPAPADETASNSQTEGKADQKVAVADRERVPRTSGLSGGRVEETLTDDGNVVRTYKPGTRSGNGPLIIEASRVGQDQRTAAFPNEDLLEDTSDGKIPVIGLDGTRPMDQYARPWSGARGTRIAIVVGGLGLSQTGTQRALKQLPGEVTLAFAASGNSLPRWMQEARRNGHEILLQVPFEPFDYPENDPGPHTLRTDLGEAKNLAELHRAMAKTTNYTGIVNFMGGRFLSDADALEPVIRDVASRGLLFLDDGSSAQSLSGTIAGTVEAPHAFADLQLDADLSRASVLKKLDELERIARRNGTAIGVASAFDESVDAIREWCEEAGSRGIEIVGVASLADILAKKQ
ncbi:divergent polysaccharide deacetylase family protein [Shinella curvata]|uniref:Divergent polysaccharide deacetylase family protein n=1 Tax=Shinella curvata TaxID=1817964 RepID=A0ABT8XKS1_9HYPH|nr:divergent polysaccharide deacetylase family protein [Shinella curvata]MCJ8056456.1 divergent polysaccharide deacetylase family protein [Shinella curvata]MDO6124334.1 divergent polysaccharide deacetylase family protein [Shinella curvata]